MSGTFPRVFYRVPGCLGEVFAKGTSIFFSLRLFLIVFYSNQFQIAFGPLF